MIRNVHELGGPAGGGVGGVRGGPVARGEHLHTHLHGPRGCSVASAAGGEVLLVCRLDLAGQLHVLEHALQLGRVVRPALLMIEKEV